MGIPGLTRQAEEHAERVTYSPDGTATRNAIIDGPALAYHVLNLCISQRTSRRSALDDLPSYQELGVSTISWLDSLSDYGFKINSIIFDGYLPAWKKNERLQRVRQSLKRLVAEKAKRQNYQLGHLGESTFTKIDCRSALSHNRLEQVAAPPCFISAILDSLYDHATYAPITRVVPGEADGYCAAAARDADSPYIFTGDSDLLVQDLGLGGKVIFFKDLDSEHVQDSFLLQALEHCPRRLATVLGVSDLIGTAYLVKQRFHRTLSEAAALVKTQPPSGPAYTDFKDQYTTDGEVCRLMDYLEKNHREDIIREISKMEPRTLELVLQLSVGTASRHGKHSGQTLYFFLPFLLEDPSRAAAFQTSGSLLKLTYSLLRLVDESFDSVTEYRRRGLDMMPSVVTLHSLEQTMEQASHTASWLLEAQQTYAALPEPARWRMISAAIVTSALRDAERPLPAYADVSLVVLNNDRPALSWELLHLKAQVQGILFSISLLRQVIDVILSVTADSSILSEPHSTALHTLRATLRNLPGTASLFDWEDATLQMQGKDVLDIAGVLRELVRTDTMPNDGFEHQNVKRRKKRKMNGVSAAETTSYQRPKGNNPFDLLAGM
ncbi:hypothetical protein CAC42_3290 [Sphaceloma murrayae]|uniref:Asteroid domain-containing protein n=1 Tax=Sphaceloma murrayae TaxID=2082308 RepID=A0A2K1QFG6_9PEZI|nr:hypothetical protein CAC42_3290 [Sphaceloma murrayae]